MEFGVGKAVSAIRIYMYYLMVSVVFVERLMK